MSGSIEQPPVIVLGNRWLWGRLISGTVLALLWTLPHVIADGVKSNPIIDYLIPALVVYSLMLVTWNAIAPTRLTISPEGINLKSLWRSRHWAWAEAGNFRAVTYNRKTFVGFDQMGASAKNPHTRRYISRVTGSDATLVGATRMPAEDLAKLLNRARDRWLGKAVDSAPAPMRKTLRGTLFFYYAAILTGRLDRKTFCLGHLAIAAVLLGLGLLLRLDTVLYPLGFVFSSFLIAGRLRDLGWSPLWRLLLLPFVALAVSLVVPLAAAFGLPPSLYRLVSIAAALLLLAPLAIKRGDPLGNTFGLPMAGEPPVDQVFS